MLVMTQITPGGLHAAEKGDVVRIGGTGCALGGMKKLAQAFQKSHPGAVVTVAPSLGSDGGIKAVLTGALDLAVSARPLRDDEREKGAAAFEYAKTPFIFVTSHKGETYDLSLQRLASIYAGETKAWPDGTPIRVILRPAGDADTLMLRCLSPEMDRAVQSALSREGMVTAVTDQENADIIEKIRGGFGASTLAQVQSEQRPVRTLRVNGEAPGIATLTSGSYPFYKTLFAVTGPNVSTATMAFISFLNSPAGRTILTRSGHLAPGGGR